MLREALGIQRRALGAAHPHIVQSLENLAAVLARRNEPAGAEEAQREALAIALPTFGETHPRVVAVRIRLASMLFDMSESARAEEECRAITAIRRDAGTLAMLGRSLLGQGKHAEAEPVLREAVAATPAGHTLRPTTIGMLGAALAGQRKFAEAEPLLVAGYEETTSPEPRRRALARVVELYEAWGKPEQAAAWRAKAR